MLSTLYGSVASITTKTPHTKTSLLKYFNRSIVSSVLSRNVNPKKDEPLPPPQEENEGFRALGVAPWMTQMLQFNNMPTPTAIQTQAIPTLLTGRDALVGSGTGTGKTMTFLIPVIQNMIRDEADGIVTRPNRPRAMVIVPTRELGAQVLAMAKSLCHHSDARFRAAFATGGESRVKQREALRGETSFAARRATAQISSQERYKIVAISIPIRHRMRTLGMDKQDSREVSYVKAKWIRSKFLERVKQRELRDNDMQVWHDTQTNTRELRLTPRGSHALNELLREYNATVTDIDNETRDLQRADTEFSGGSMEIFIATEPGPTPKAVEAGSVSSTQESVDSVDMDAEDKIWDDEMSAEEAVDPDMPQLEAMEDDADVEVDNEPGWIDMDDIDEDGDIPSATPRYLSPNAASFGKLKNTLGGNRKATPEETLSQMRNIDLIVGTPGRIRALMATDELFLSDLRSLVFDEADFLFHESNGFEEDLDAIVKPLNRRLFNLFAKEHGIRAKEDPLLKRQGQLTHAERMSDKVANASNTQLIFAGASLQRDFIKAIREDFPLYRDLAHPRPFEVLQSKQSMCLPSRLRQTWVRLGGKDKMTVLKDLFSSSEFQKEQGKTFASSVIVFCNSVPAARAVCWALNEAGIAAIGTHGDIPPKLRAQNWTDFVRKRSAVMVCTDLASRGLDTRFVSKIIMFDFPTSPVAYLHRVGRTARAGDEGHVVSLLTKGDEVLAKAIDRAHKSNSPIGNLSGSLEVYRPDLPPALRPGATHHEVKAFAPSIRDVRTALKEREYSERKENQEMAAKRRTERKQTREDEKAAAKPWHRASGLGQGRKMDMSPKNKMDILRRAREMRRYEESHGKGSISRDFKAKTEEREKPKVFDEMATNEKAKTARRIIGIAKDKLTRHVYRGEVSKTAERKQSKKHQKEMYQEYVRMTKEGADRS